MVFFRKSDVIATGEIMNETSILISISSTAEALTEFSKV
jgi:hypothetical protein